MFRWACLGVAVIVVLTCSYGLYLLALADVTNSPQTPACVQVCGAGKVRVCESTHIECYP